MSAVEIRGAGVHSKPTGTPPILLRRVAVDAGGTLVLVGPARGALEVDDNTHSLTSNKRSRTDEQNGTRAHVGWAPGVSEACRDESEGGKGGTNLRGQGDDNVMRLASFAPRDKTARARWLGWKLSGSRRSG